MKKSAIAIGIALASLLAATGYAQTKGEADPEQSKAVATKKATATEKAAAKQARQAEGKLLAKKHEGVADETPGTQGVAKAATPAERKAAAAERKTTAAAAVKKGETTSGEK